MRDPVLSHSVPIYATNADARAVATGKFGAVPIEISNESELEMLVGACGSVIAQVRTRSGKVGWTPIGSLPLKLGDLDCPTEATNISTTVDTQQKKTALRRTQ